MLGIFAHGRKLGAGITGRPSVIYPFTVMTATNNITSLSLSGFNAPFERHTWKYWIWLVSRATEHLGFFISGIRRILEARSPAVHVGLSIQRSITRGCRLLASFFSSSNDFGFNHHAVWLSISETVSFVKREELVQVCVHPRARRDATFE